MQRFDWRRNKPSQVTRSGRVGGRRRLRSFRLSCVTLQKVQDLVMHRGMYAFRSVCVCESRDVTLFFIV